MVYGHLPGNRKQWTALIVGAAVGMLFPFFWPRTFWLNMLAAFISGVVAYLLTLLIMRKRNK
jgi:hypothetical protein